MRRGPRDGNMFLLFCDRKSRKPWAWDLGRKTVKCAAVQHAKDGEHVRFPFPSPSCLQTLPDDFPRGECFELGLCPLITRFVILQLLRFFIFRILAPCLSGGPEDDGDLLPGVLGS